MESFAAAMGVSVPVFRFLLCFLASVPVGFFSRFVHGSMTRHLYAGITGAVLSYFSFGAYSNLHFLIPMSVGYASMVLCRRVCGIFTFVFAFGYLIICHVYYMSGDAWKEGGIDSTGALMVLVLKVISCSINYNDGLLKEECLRDSQKRHRLLKLPSFAAYFGYCLCCGSHFAGPVYEINDYLDWAERNGIWSHSRRQPSPYWATVRALAQAVFCIILYLFLIPHFPLSRINEEIYKKWGFGMRCLYQYMTSFVARWKYYFIWSISEAAFIISGLGFYGWTDSSQLKPCWDRAKNVDILGVEFVKSSVELPLVWNIQVSTWLRHYVYERLIKKGQRPGFFQLVVTQIVSAVWHGLYPGYMVFFIHSALMIAGSRVIYRWQQSISENSSPSLKMLLGWGNSAYSIFVLNTSAVGFQVLSMDETFTAYRSILFAPTLLPLSIILLGMLLKPKRLTIVKDKGH